MNELEVFSDALAITSSDRRNHYLDEACGTDEKFRRRIEVLLEAAERVEGFMDSSPNLIRAQREELAETHDAPEQEQIGAKFGPFKLLQKLGEGGMGTVYLAEQKQPVKRRVALKIVKAGMDSSAVVARFEAERQALSMMDHPNIARALDAGALSNGRPYFVMELVKGVPITEYCDEYKLSVRQRIELFIPICNAVQHAHQKGIVHRDLKPSNILIAEYDGKPIPKVIDFGIAKAIHQPLTEKTLVTQIGQVIGTLEYMSPEQAKASDLDVDTRSDIYSLGVVLYELLVGRTPFDKKRLRTAALDDLIRIIREEEPPRPSKRLDSTSSHSTLASRRSSTPAKLNTLVRGELDWIAMKALEKDRGRRYQSCGEFAEDLRRYLQHEQVRACPPTPVYRLKKFVRRNAGVVVAVSAVIVTLAVGLTSSTIERQRTDEANRRLAAQNEQLQTVARNAVHNYENKLTLQAQHEKIESEYYVTLDRFLARLDSEPELHTPAYREFRADFLATMTDFWDRVVERSKSETGEDGAQTADFRLQRALAQARIGNHEKAFGEVLDLTRDPETTSAQFSKPTYIWSAEMARICSLCAEATADNQALAGEYARRGNDFADMVIADLRRQLTDVGQQNFSQDGEMGNGPARRALVLAELSSFLNDPHIQALGPDMDVLNQFDNVIQ